MVDRKTAVCMKNSPNRESNTFGLRRVMSNLYSPDPFPVLLLDICFRLQLERGCWANRASEITWLIDFYVFLDGFTITAISFG